MVGEIPRLLGFEFRNLEKGLESLPQCPCTHGRAWNFGIDPKTMAEQPYRINRDMVHEMGLGNSCDRSSPMYPTWDGGRTEGVIRDCPENQRGKVDLIWATDIRFRVQA